ncbi:MAG: M23 family metallopeptidase [Endomicrobium sp.]|nr:M23 family metallopeptidase [Endomicrobium sp.]
MKVFCVISDKLKKRITIIFIPHGKKSPFKISISLFLMCALIVSWTVITLWAGYLTSKYFDYIKAKTDNKIMQVRLLFFASQFAKTKHMLEKIQINDEKIRSLFALDTKKSIMEEGLGRNLGKGGPTPAQTNTFTAILSGNLDKFMNYSDLSQQSDAIYEQYKFMNQSYDEIVSHIYKQKSLFMATPCGWPCKGYISSDYGFRKHPIFRIRDFHPGLDIANALYAPINVTADGKVVFSGWQSGYGNVIVVDHGHNYRTVYGHLAKSLVKKDAFVTRGQNIAKMGNTGASTGSHVHYEVHFKGRTVNPKPYLTDYFFNQANRGR